MTSTTPRLYSPRWRVNVTRTIVCVGEDGHREGRLVGRTDCTITASRVRHVRYLITLNSYSHYLQSTQFKIWCSAHLYRRKSRHVRVFTTFQRLQPLVGPYSISLDIRLTKMLLLIRYRRSFPKRLTLPAFLFMEYVEVNFDEGAH